MKIQISLFLLIVLIVSSYSQNNDNYYFPPDLYTRDIMGQIMIDTTRLNYHSVQLSRFEESNIYNLNTDSTIFRLSWFRSFNLPKIITLIIYNGQAEMIVKTGNKVAIDNSHFDISSLTKDERDRFFMYQKNEIDSLQVIDLFDKGIFIKDTICFKYRSDSIKLSQDEIKEFERYIIINQFWSLPSMEKYELGFDGADWILEGLNKGKGYHLVYRWSPNKKENAAFREICEYILKLSGERRRYIY